MIRYMTVSTKKPAQPIDPEAVAEALATLPPENLLTPIVETFQALGDPTRARILYALQCRPLCVRDLAIVAGVSESAVSHQLRLLRARRLVRPQRRGTIMLYSIDDHHLSALIREAEYHADHVRSGIPDHPYPLP